MNECPYISFLIVLLIWYFVAVVCSGHFKSVFRILLICSWRIRDTSSGHVIYWCWYSCSCWSVYFLTVVQWFCWSCHVRFVVAFVRNIVQDNYTPTSSFACARDMLGFNWHSKLRTCEFLFAVSSTIYGMVWKRTHNVHHVITNAPKHDPDNQHLLFLAVNHRFLGNIFSTYHERLLPYDKAAVQYQSYVYYPILMFGRFNVYVQSRILLAQGHPDTMWPCRICDTITCSLSLEAVIFHDSSAVTWGIPGSCTVASV